METSQPALDWLFAWLEETDSQLYEYVELGKRSTLEDFEDESSDADYTYSKYNFRFSQELTDRFDWNISTLLYSKNYETLDSLDNSFLMFKGGIDYLLWEQDGRSLKLDLDLLGGRKHFFNTPAGDYERMKIASALSYRVKDLYTAKLSAGLDTYEYPDASAKDQFKPFIKAEGWRYFSERKFKLSGSYSLRSIRQEQIGRERIQRDIRAGFDYRFDLPGIRKIMVRTGWGNRDTRDEADIDADYDFEYHYSYVKTEHRINNRIDTHLKYQFFRKDYTTAGLDHRGFFLQNGWDFDICERKDLKLRFNLDAEYKQVEYDIQPADSYRKGLLEAKISLKKPKNWKCSTGLQINLYDYDDPLKDKMRYYLVVSGEKQFLKGNFRLNLDLKYRFTDYDLQSSDSKSSVRLSGLLKF